MTEGKATKTVAPKKPATLAAKLARIGKEIGTVKKSGKNQQQNYNYIEYSVVAGRIRELLDEYGVIIIPSVEEIKSEAIVTARGSGGYHYTLTMRFTIINGDDANDKIEAKWAGESADYGDKGINKAETSGTKYFLMRLFNVSEKGEEEADAKSPEVRRPVQKVMPPKPQPPTAAQRQELADLLSDVGKTEEEIAEILAQITTAAQMAASIGKARKMADERQAEIARETAEAFAEEIATEGETTLTEEE